MPQAILGKKVGMTRVFDDQGRMVPVTVLEAGPCAVLRVKTEEKDGYRALQLGFDDRVTGEQWDRIKKRFAEGKLNGNLKGLRRPAVGAFVKVKKGGVTPKRFVKEVPYSPDESFEQGDEVTAAAASEWTKVDLIGTSKGRGTQGTMRAWGFKSGPNTHGSKNRRNPGSIGLSATPAKVIKGKRMYTRWGDERCTVRNIDIVKVDTERNLILVRGGAPGAKGSYVVIRKAVAAREARQG